MNKTYIIAIVLVLIVVGGYFLVNQSAKDSAMDTDMENMIPVDVPSEYNTPVENSQAPVKEFVIDGKNFSFSPNVIKVKKGDLVKITFKNSQGFHDLVIDEFMVATKQIRTGQEETISFIADKVGTFEYYCSVGTHRALGMWGTFIVEE